MFHLWVFPLCSQIGRTIPDEVHAMVGVFEGSWTAYGIDEAQNVVKHWTWTDTLILDRPVIEQGRAYVHATNEMRFEGGRPPYTATFKEGHFIHEDGNVGAPFVELFGQTYGWQRLASNISAYSPAAHPEELAALGFSNMVSAQHVFVRITSQEDGIETHRVSRLTNVHWREANGSDRFLHYTSLEGAHKRQS